VAIVNGYATLDEFKAWIGDELDVPETNAVFEQQVEAASRWIDRRCDRQFWQTAPGVIRTFDAWSSRDLRIDDVVTVTAVATDDDDDGTYETVWAASDYQLALATSAPAGSPYRRIRAVAGRLFPLSGRRIGRVQVTGTWGWSVVPDAIHEACLMQAARLLKRRNSPEGITGFGSEFGHIRISQRGDPDVEALIAPYATGVMVA
jgi:hypothetical protein